MTTKASVDPSKTAFDCCSSGGSVLTSHSVDGADWVIARERASALSFKLESSPSSVTTHTRDNAGAEGKICETNGQLISDGLLPPSCSGSVGAPDANATASGKRKVDGGNCSGNGILSIVCR